MIHRACSATERRKVISARRTGQQRIAPGRPALREGRGDANAMVASSTTG